MQVVSGGDAHGLAGREVREVRAEPHRVERDPRPFAIAENGDRMGAKLELADEGELSEMVGRSCETYGSVRRARVQRLEAPIELPLTRSSFAVLGKFGGECPRALSNDVVLGRKCVRALVERRVA